MWDAEAVASRMEDPRFLTDLIEHVARQKQVSPSEAFARIVQSLSEGLWDARDDADRESSSFESRSTGSTSVGVDTYSDSSSAAWPATPISDTSHTQRIQCDEPSDQALRELPDELFASPQELHEEVFESPQELYEEVFESPPSPRLSTSPRSASRSKSVAEMKTVVYCCLLSLLTSRTMIYLTTLNNTHS